MSMSTRVVGFRPPDAKWKEMKAIWDACRAAGVDEPSEVETFFEGEPDDTGIRVDLEASGAAETWSGDMEEGYQIDLSKLPKNITHIRFCNSW